MKAHPVERRDDDPLRAVSEAVDRHGDLMFMMVPRYVWQALVMQGQFEGTGPGQVLDKALRAYLEQCGSRDVAAMLHEVAARPR